MYDVVVVGAGPIGSIAAKYAAKSGARTLILEEHPSIGTPVQCTGLLSTRALKTSEAGKGNFVIKKIKGALIYSPNGEELTIGGGTVKAYVVDRKLFDRHLAHQALDAGAELLLKTKALTLTNKGDCQLIEARKEGEKIQIKTRIVISAEGVQNKIARQAGLPGPEKLLSGVQIEARYQPADPERVEVFLGETTAPGFFAWSVPLEDNLARLGLALDPKLARKPPWNYLENLLKHNKRYQGSRTELVIGGIPLGPPSTTATASVLTIGDTAGQVKPTSGGGIYTGGVCAKIAGEIAAKTSQGKTTLAEYEKKWRQAIGRELAIGMKLHKALARLSDRELNRLISFLKEPEITETINTWGDMDHPSLLLGKLATKGGIRLLPLLLKTLL